MMDRSQAKELFTLITTVRHVKEMRTIMGVVSACSATPGCLLCEGVRHGLYEQKKAADYRLDMDDGFMRHFGCTNEEATDVIFHNHIPHGPATETTGENYWKAGRELIEKYGYGDLFEEALSFAEIMDELKKETVK